MLSCILLRLGVFCPVLTLLSLATMGQESFPPRQVLGIRSQSDEFKRIVDRICNPATDMMADTQLKRSGVYFRLTEKNAFCRRAS
ncbi:MAG: hypothetical protein VX768_04700 [Planctomycetota bacterium]|nr:hypothetical protein [Planctomycetota bacterium]